MVLQAFAHFWEFNLDTNDESRSLNSSLGHQPNQESMRKPRQSEENLMQWKTGVKINKPGIFARVAKIFARIAKISQP